VPWGPGSGHFFVQRVEGRCDEGDLLGRNVFDLSVIENQEDINDQGRDEPDRREDRNDD